MPKSIVLDPGWFNRDRIKFEDQWRGIQLFLKSNRVTAMDNKITTILAHLKKGLASIYAQKKLDQLEEETDTHDQDKFVRKIKIMFSNKIKVADTKQKIETFKQDKKCIANIIIEFEALVMKSKTDDMHVIFLLKKNVQTDIIKIILGYLLIIVPEMLREQKVAIILVEQGYEFTESQKDYKDKDPSALIAMHMAKKY